ncbi:aminopeptidase P family protein [Faecalitalea cylindroides]|nr:aminopeptidase P family protein [Faecalitalea cylindroides]MDB7952805.1 aminopeptidase P family protein [Faecalitalea cylindroides]MDB7959438.1 aminopeptidase P family protein [Faecalitalea cylindroides]MDB7961250.1 aminopeptidase P family protein [Faecalitalea cylindroides]MDB7963312.1 aminopeptidase P family protein [Faecalitalea cylindroides]MDB7965211.1 aminopeptidase P family protein [Faecalitalea cylindroides]
MNMIKERLMKLREEMNKEGMQAYIIPTSDFHETEYVSEYFAARKYMSGFTGSAGVLVVLLDKAGLWTDGRYFIQAANQLAGSGIDLMKQGQEDTPSIEEYIVTNLTQGSVVGFDGRVMNVNDANKYKQAFMMHDIKMVTDKDLVGRIWDDRPALPCTETFHYDEKYAGKSISEKLTQVREAMKGYNCRSHIVTKIDEIAWLYNLRAHDVPHFPVALAYTIIKENDAMIYIDASRLDEESKTLFAQNHIQVKDYEAIYEDVKTLEGPVLVDGNFVNSKIVYSLNTEIVYAQDPIVLLKAMKNETELANTRNAHIKDGVACTKFMYWLMQNVNNGISEMSAQEKLQELRKEQADYLEDSFNTICAYKEHAAMMHYSSNEETNVELKPEGMLLVDSGGQYLDGTTDITRTFVLGSITEEEKKWFTLALKGHIRLEKANFLYGCRGLNLDILARGPLWDLDMDYQCGTGHGVGHLSNVHEAPNGFRWKIVPERNDSCVLEEGMITSNEPGVYVEGEFGIRHENEMVVVKGNKNFYGQFMHFETLTFVPFDRKGIDKSLLSEDELAWLNDYHASVYEKISPFLTNEEAEWLKEACRPL